MYINPFILGVMATLAAEAVLLVVAALVANKKNKK